MRILPGGSHTRQEGDAARGITLAACLGFMGWAIGLAIVAWWTLGCVAPSEELADLGPALAASDADELTLALVGSCPARPCVESLQCAPCGVCEQGACRAVPR